MVGMLFLRQNTALVRDVVEACVAP